MKKSLILAACGLLLLSGCGKSEGQVQDENTALMKIGDVTVDKGDVYTLIRNSDGTSLVLTLALNDIYDQEVPVTDEMKEEAQQQYDEYVEANPDFADQVLAAGYESVDDYIKSVLVPNLQSKELTILYFKDNEDSIVSEYKPSIAQIIQCSSEEDAQNALKALKDGESVEDVVEEYASETASYKGSEQVVTTLNTTLPTRLINTLAEAKEDGVQDEIFVSDDETSWYIAVLVSNNYEDNVEQYVEALSSNSDLAKEIMISYLTKYNFEVHDQFLFDQFKLNNPEYLVTRPDLSESDS